LTSRPDSERSWLFGPHLWYKLWYAGPAGASFGLKYAITNWGLQLVPVSTHLLLQATDLLWTVSLARVVNSETLNVFEGVAVVLSTAGTLMVTVDATAFLDTPFVPLLVNVLTPLTLALSVTMLRRAVKELMNPRGRLRSTMTLIELTCLKLAVASLVCLATACTFEGDIPGFQRPSSPPYGDTPERSSRAWWTALANYPLEGTALIASASTFVLVFQVNITWLTELTSAVTVGMAGSAKVVPQWFLSEFFGLGPRATPMVIGGAVLIVASNSLYMLSKLTPSLGPSSSSSSSTTSTSCERHASPSGIGALGFRCCHHRRERCRADSGCNLCQSFLPA